MLELPQSVLNTWARTPPPATPRPVTPGNSSHVSRRVQKFNVFNVSCVSCESGFPLLSGSVGEMDVTVAPPEAEGIMATLHWSVEERPLLSKGDTAVWGKIILFYWRFPEFSVAQTKSEQYFNNCISSELHKIRVQLLFSFLGLFLRSLWKVCELFLNFLTSFKVLSFYWSLT